MHRYRAQTCDKVEQCGFGPMYEGSGGREIEGRRGGAGGGGWVVDLETNVGRDAKRLTESRRRLQCR